MARRRSLIKLAGLNSYLAGRPDTLSKIWVHEHERAYLRRYQICGNNLCPRQGPRHVAVVRWGLIPSASRKDTRQRLEKANRNVHISHHLSRNYTMPFMPN